MLNSMYCNLKKIKLKFSIFFYQKKFKIKTDSLIFNVRKNHRLIIKIYEIHFFL